MPTRKNPPPKADFGRALQQMRAASGMTQEDLLLATSRRHVGRIEQGHQVPSIRVIENLAETLQIHPMTLVTAAYCPDFDAAAVEKVLEVVKADFLELASDESA
ncbi:MAG: helix-turn-helix transcriptional regulator [Acidovorax sp.]